MARLVCCCSLIALVSIPAQATVIWRGDFSTGDLSQWSSKEVVSSNLVNVVTSPVPAGESHAMEVLVQQQDVIFGGNRTELDYTADSPQEGDVRYYHWQTMWPTNYQSANYWQLFTQWHQYVNGGSPPLAFLVNGEQIMLGNNLDFYYWTGTLTRGVWHDFVVRVTWSSNASVGGVEVWYDGQHVCPFTHGATLYAGDTVYLKQGLYRKNLITWDQTIYHAGMTVATDLADVLPSAAADAGTPVVPDAGVTPPPNTTGTGTGTGTVDAGPTPELDAGSTVAPPADDAGTPGEVGSTQTTTTQTTSTQTASTETPSAAPAKYTACGSAGTPAAAALILLGWLLARRRASRRS